MTEERKKNEKPRRLPPARHHSGEAGVALVEYALLVMLVAMTSLGAMSYLGDSTNAVFTNVRADAFNANGGICLPSTPGYPDCP